MSRYLIEPYIKSALSRGKSVEQFLGPCENAGLSCIRFAVMSGAPSGVRIDVYEVEDVGSPDYLDIYDFPNADPDDEPVRELEADTIPDALEVASREISAPVDRWVNQGVSQDEYLDYLRVRPRGAV